MDTDQVLSCTEVLVNLGIEPPGTPTAREIMYFFVSDTRLTEPIKNKRIQDTIETQRKYVGKTVCRTREPHIKGKVLYIKPILNSCTFRTELARKEDSITRTFEAFVKWNIGRPSYARLNMIEILNP